MPRYKLVVLSNPVEGREAEYQDWYQNVHLGQVVAFKGFKSARRFRLAKNLVEREALPYLAIYEIETDDLEGVMEEVQKHAGTDRLLVSETLDVEHSFAAIYEEFGPVVKLLSN